MRLSLPSRAPALLALCLTGCAVTTLMTPRASWPLTDGAIPVAGSRAEIRIQRDEWGVPHVRAASTADALYGQGFVHAQDRLFQADLVRHLAYGRLAEWRGADVVPLDRFMRGLELARRAQAFYDAASPEIRAEIDAYTAGFNAGMRTAKDLPIEYRLLQREPDPWQPRDCMALVWMNAWNLAENYVAEISAMGLRSLDSEAMDALFRVDPTEPHVDPRWDRTRALPVGAWTPEFALFDAALGAGDAMAQGRARATAQADLPGGQEAVARDLRGLNGRIRAMLDPDRGYRHGFGSNNWVIGGERSADGKPIVANDPHLHQMAPSLWYAVDIGAPGLHAAGFSLPGAPYVTLGHNGQVAWGFTNVMADTVDIALLERKAGPGGEDGYLLAGEWRPFTSVDAPVTLDDGTISPGAVTWTAVGPVISDMGASPGAGPGYVAALRWYALETPDETTRLIRTLNVAATVEDGLKTRDIPSMIAQNLVIADTAGDYAWQPFGTLPAREGWEGRLPYPASDPGYSVTMRNGLIPGERRPDRGYVVSANARPPHMNTDPAAGFPAWKISTRFYSSHRHRRIMQLIEAIEKHTPDTVAAIQADRYDLHAAELLPILLPQEGPLTAQEPGATCERLLRAWDRQQSVGSVGATVWNRFQLELIKLALEPRLGPALEHYLAAVSPGASLLDGRREVFIPDLRAATSRALDQTCDRMRDAYGMDVRGWAWGSHHPLSLSHPFSAASPLLKGWSRPTVPYGGSVTTVNVGTFDWRDLDTFPVGSVPSLRLIMPTSNLPMSRFSHPGGASGHVKHPHTEDMFGDWLQGSYGTLRFEDAAVRAGSREELILVPDAAKP